MCLLGKDVDADLLGRFMEHPQVVRCVPGDWTLKTVSCKCLPKLNVGGAQGVFADRLAMIGDCGVSRLYKDGIGAAYRTAKACAATAMLHGVGQRDFEKFFRPTCRRLERDNRLGAMIFGGAGLFQKLKPINRAMFRLTRAEQSRPAPRRTMSMMLWDLFTGSAPYADVVRRGLSPAFLTRFGAQCVRSIRR